LSEIIPSSRLGLRSDEVGQKALELLHLWSRSQKVQKQNFFFHCATKCYSTITTWFQSTKKYTVCTITLNTQKHSVRHKTSYMTFQVWNNVAKWKALH